MSRLTVQKISDFRKLYLSQDCFGSGNYRALYENVSNDGFGNNFKNLALCAFDKFNSSRPTSGTQRLNKQEFYCCLFAMGYPLGLIAKTLLNANLAPVRNAVLMYKGVVMEYITNTNAQTTLLGTFYSRLSFQPFEKFLENLISFANYVGGANLTNKLISGNDAFSLFEANNRITEFKNPFVSSPTLLQYALDINTTVTNRQGGSRRGAVRRTGLTTSRVAAATTQIPARPNASQGVTPSALPQAQNISAPAPTGTPVRDIEFTNTLGCEIEIVRPVGVTSREFVNDLIRELKKSGLDVQAVGYTHQTTSYWKITSDASIKNKRGETYGGRDGDFGCEIVSPILKGKRGLAELKKCIGAIRRAGGSVNQSVGVHLHMGANGLQLDHFKNILYNYKGFEPIIGQTLYKTRRNSRWAQPLNSISNFDNKLNSATDFRSLCINVFGFPPEDYRGSGRYYTVNLYSFLKHGSIEFRQLQGSVEEDTILYWAYFIHFLIEVSKKKRLSFFDYKQVRNITPVWLSTYLGNRAFDMSDDNYNAV